MEFQRYVKIFNILPIEQTKPTLKSIWVKKFLVEKLESYLKRTINNTSNLDKFRANSRKLGKF